MLLKSKHSEMGYQCRCNFKDTDSEMDGSEMVITERVARQRIRYLRRIVEVRTLTARERRNLDNLTAMFDTNDDVATRTRLKVTST